MGPKKKPALDQVATILRVRLACPSRAFRAVSGNAAKSRGAFLDVEVRTRKMGGTPRIPAQTATLTPRYTVRASGNAWLWGPFVSSADRRGAGQPSSRASVYSGN